MNTLDSNTLDSNKVSLAFGGLWALRDVTLSVRQSTVTGLIGPNGAGKSSMINVLTGFCAPTAGEVRCNGTILQGMSSYSIRKLGISRTFQAGRLFRHMTVLENVAAAGMALGWSLSRSGAAAREALKLLGIEATSSRFAGELSYTDQRRAAIARALMGYPSYLLLDEPAAGMSEHEIEALCEVIQNIVKEHGTGILLIEHNFPMILRLCSTTYVLDGGEVIECGNADVIRQSARLRAAYLGGGLESEPRSTAKETSA